MRKPTSARKLLIASVGVATINYVAACSAETSGNLLPPPQGGAAGQAGTAGGAGAGTAGSPTSGNLVAPPPAGSGGSE